jgi:hypothetical protein
MFPLPARPSSSLELRHAATDHAIFVVVPERRFLAIGGVGGPTGADFAFAASALRLTSELLGRRLRREGLPVPVRVAAVECLWAPPEPLAPAGVPAAFGDRSRWTWRQAIALPDGTSAADIDAAIDEGRQRAGRDVALIRELVLVEGLAGQVLHAGSEDTERDAVATLYAAIAEEGLAPTGWLHTIALSPGGGGPVDRRRVLIRQPASRIEPPAGA